MTKKNQRLLAWGALALLGAPLWGAAKIARHVAGCPWSGDCYLPGWNIHNTLEELLILWLVLLPLAVLKMVRIQMDI
jgi:hypothetical protein